MEEDCVDYYGENKCYNEEFSLEKYVKVNPDLYFGSTTVQSGARHWALHGRHEWFRSYRSGHRNTSIMATWAEVFKYLRTTKNTMIEMNKTAFVVTTCVKTPVHLDYLTECVGHIRRIYPSMYIYVMEDNSAPEMEPMLQETLAKLTGSILKHPRPNVNVSTCFSTTQPMVKVWQGR